MSESEVESPVRQIDKTCTVCGTHHDCLPETAKYQSGDALTGYWFNCQCDSTLFIPDKKKGDKS